MLRVLTRMNMAVPCRGEHLHCTAYHTQIIKFVMMLFLAESLAIQWTTQRTMGEHAGNWELSPFRRFHLLLQEEKATSIID